MSTMLFTNNKDKIIFKAKELSYYVLSGLYVKKGITGIPSFAEKFSSLTRFVNADKEDFGVLIQYKIDHFYRDVGGSNHKTVCAFLTEDIKGIGNASKKYLIQESTE